jgi:hypothetical protein
MRNAFSIFFLIVFLAFNSFAQTTTPPDGSLEFDSTKEHHVNHGIFWKPGVNHGVFFWEAWVKPYANAQYVISDGNGGAHALLFGFSGGTTRLALAGNFWSNATNSGIGFGTDETVPVNQWCHIAVGWDGTNIVTFINGIPSGIAQYSGHRSTIVGSGAGVLFVGGSDHSNFNGKIARIRGFEGVLPMDNLLTTFKPEKYFRSSYLKANGDIVTASFLVDYAVPAKTYSDLSLGYNGANHIGILSTGTDTGSFGNIMSISNILPQWTPEGISPPVYVQRPISIPKSAIVYDSFSRADVTPAFGGSGLGVLEKTSTQYKVDSKWRGNYLNDWGISQERAYNGGNSVAPVYVETRTSNMDVRATRLFGAYSTGNIGIVYRYQDDNNYGYVFVGGNIVYLIEKVNGIYALTSNGVQTPLWYELRVMANGNSVKAYCNGVEVISATTTNLLTATKAGIVGSAGTGERFDDFAVYLPQ